MKRGPKPTPLAALLAAGSRRGQERAGHEPIGDGQQPYMPRTLSMGARAHWRKIVRVMIPGVLCRDNAASLGRYCEFLAKWDQLIADPLGDFDATMKLADKLLRLEEHFGMTPASRGRINVAKAKIEPKKSAAGYSYFDHAPRIN
jgi:phage terminase small subunit